MKADHVRLRSLLNTVLVGACVAQQDPRLGRRVRAALDRVRAELLAHLDYEEEALVELLRSADAWGPQRADALVREHEQERTMIEAVIEDFDAGDRTLQELTDELAWLAASIEKDMTEEERAYLGEEALGDGSAVSIRQTDG